MCGCGDLKYAKKNHSHSYATQAAIDALTATHAADVATLQAAIDALTSQHAADVATLLDQDNTLISQIGVLQLQIQNNMDYVQSQLDAINQALIDCGCVSSPCQPYEELFEGVSTGGATTTAVGWTIDNNGFDKLRSKRNSSGDQQCAVTIPLPAGTILKDQMLLEWSLFNDTNVERTEVDVNFTGHGIENMYTDSSIGGFNARSIVLDAAGLAIAEDTNIAEVIFTIHADVAGSQTIWKLDYVRLVCP